MSAPAEERRARMSERFDDIWTREIYELGAEAEHAAARQVTAHASNPAEARELLAMLGLLPDEDGITEVSRAAAGIRTHSVRHPTGTCAGSCGRRLVAEKAHVEEIDRDEIVRVYARGMCAPCWRATRKEESEQ